MKEDQRQIAASRTNCGSRNAFMNIELADIFIITEDLIHINKKHVKDAYRTRRQNIPHHNDNNDIGIPSYTNDTAMATRTTRAVAVVPIIKAVGDAAALIVNLIIKHRDQVHQQRATAINTQDIANLKISVGTLANRTTFNEMRLDKIDDRITLTQGLIQANQLEQQLHDMHASYITYIRDSIVQFRHDIQTTADGTTPRTLLTIEDIKLRARRTCHNPRGHWTPTTTISRPTLREKDDQLMFIFAFAIEDEDSMATLIEIYPIPTLIGGLAASHPSRSAHMR